MRRYDDEDIICYSSFATYHDEWFECELEKGHDGRHKQDFEWDGQSVPVLWHETTAPKGE